MRWAQEAADRLVDYVRRCDALLLEFAHETAGTFVDRPAGQAGPHLPVARLIANEAVRARPRAPIGVSTEGTLRLARAGLEMLGVDMTRYGERDYTRTQSIGAALVFLGIFSLVDAGTAGKNTQGPYIDSLSRLPMAIVGQPYAHTFTSVRGTPPVNYALSPESTLPFGLTLTSAGVLSGAPANSGAFSFVVRASDAAGLFDEQPCTLRIFKGIKAPAGLVGFWKAEGNAQDSFGTNHGTQCNGAGFSAGKVGLAFSLDGTDDYIQISDAPALRPVSVTAEAWVAFDSLAGNGQIFGKEVGSRASYFLTLFAYALRAGVGDATGEEPQLIVPFSPALGRWYHVAYTFDDITKLQALYLDGVQVAAGAATKSIGYDTNPLLLGAESIFGRATTFLQGRIDEAAIYNRALSRTEIASIYNAGPAGKRP